MLWSIDSCQNKVSADQHHLTESRAQVSTHRGQVFFEVIRRRGTGFQMIAGSSLIFLKFIWNMLCLCAAQLKFWFDWPRTRKFSQLLQAGKTVAFDFSRHVHALVTLTSISWPYRGLMCQLIEVIYLEAVRWPVNYFTRSRSMFSLILSS